MLEVYRTGPTVSIDKIRSKYGVFRGLSRLLTPCRKRCKVGTQQRRCRTEGEMSDQNENHPILGFLCLVFCGACWYAMFVMLAAMV